MGKVELGGRLRGSVWGRGNTNLGVEAEKHRNMTLLIGEERTVWRCGQSRAVHSKQS